MPKKNVMDRLKSRTRNTPLKRGSSGGSFQFFTSRPFWYLVTLFVIIVLVAFFYEAILDAIGWGLILVIIAVVALGILTWRRKLKLLYRRWYKWLGASSSSLLSWEYWA